MQHYQTKKRFGQHFLHDSHIINKIIAAIHPQADEHLLEIGPGLGALTFPLLNKIKHIHVIDIDRDIIQALTEKQDPRITIHNLDALQLDLSSLDIKTRPIRMVGNLPYNISTPLIFHLLDTPEQIRDMHFMLQKEVVDRMTATPGGKDYGRLSIMVQYHCYAENLFHVGPGAFRPPPKVDSAVVRLTPWQTLPHIAINKQHFSALVAQAFTMRRKTLRNALKGLVEMSAVEAAGVDPGLRPENLSVADFVTISNLAADHESDTA